MDILEILNQDNYLMYNLNLARKCGVNSAILVGEIARNILKYLNLQEN